MAVKMIPPGLLGPLGRHYPDCLRGLSRARRALAVWHIRLVPARFLLHTFNDPGNLFSTTVKINSSYLELADICYHQRGLNTAIGLSLGLFFVFMTIACIVFIGHPMFDRKPEAYFVLAILVLGFGFFAYFLFYLPLTNELFNSTHNPVRFDSRNNMVYAFLHRSKEVVAVPWDKVYFDIKPTGHVISFLKYDLCGRILGDDGLTDKGHFVLGYCSEDHKVLLEYFKFIIAYMDIGPQRMVDKIQYCLPIAERKESAMWALKTVISWTGLGWFLLLFPIMVPVWICRLLANITNKLPVWPDWVEEKCRIELDDPYVRDASMNPEVQCKLSLISNNKV